MVCNAFLAFAYYPEWFADSKILIGLLALVVGWSAARTCSSTSSTCSSRGCPGRLSRGVMPYAFLLPAVALIGLMLLYPTIQTINYSFANADSTEYVGLENYRDDLQDQRVLAVDLQQRPVAAHRARRHGLLRR